MYRLFFSYMSIHSVVDRSNKVNENSGGKKKKRKKKMNLTIVSMKFNQCHKKRNPTEEKEYC